MWQGCGQGVTGKRTRATSALIQTVSHRASAHDASPYRPTKEPSPRQQLRRGQTAGWRLRRPRLVTRRIFWLHLNGDIRVPAKGQE